MSLTRTFEEYATKEYTPLNDPRVIFAVILSGTLSLAILIFAIVKA